MVAPVVVGGGRAAVGAALGIANGELWDQGYQNRIDEGQSPCEAARGATEGMEVVVATISWMVGQALTYSTAAQAMTPLA